jgi:hypothetical protein
MAEREGFEPPIPVKVCPLSRRIVSTAHAPLRVKTAVSFQRSAISKTWIPCFARNGTVGRLTAHQRPTEKPDLPPTANSHSQQLTPLPEKLLQQLAAAPGQNASTHFHAVIQLWMIENLHH